MTKHQCRTSLIGALALLTVIASAVGSISASFLLTKANPLDRPQKTNVTESSVTGAGEEEPLLVQNGMTVFSMDFSSWSPNQVPTDYTETVSAPFYLFVFPAFFIVFLVLILSLFLVNRNLKIEPIYLLSGKME